MTEDPEDPEDMSKHLAILAYLATMVQFCIEEWEGGFFEKRDLNANYLLSLYICHFDGLKHAAWCAPDRLLRKYNEWFEDALAAAEAPLVYKRKYIQPIILPEHVRPDTPPPTSDDAPHPQTTSSAAGPSHPPATVNPASQTTSPAPRPSRLPRTSPMRRYSPLAPTAATSNYPPPRARVRQITPLHSPSHRSHSPEAPHIAPFGGPLVGQLPIHLSPPRIPTPTPERDTEGRYTARAKGKGPALD